MAKETRLEVSKPGPLASSPVERAQEQRGADDEDQGEGHLQRDDALRRRTPPKPVPPRSRSELIRLSPPAWRAGARPLRRPAARLAKKREGEQAKAEARRAARWRRASCGRNAISARMASGASGDAEHTTGEREEEAIGEELAADAAAGSAESEAGADLAAPCRAAGEEEAGDIQAGEAEQNAGGGEQEPERLGQAAAQRRMALGRGVSSRVGGQIVAGGGRP